MGIFIIGLMMAAGVVVFGYVFAIMRVEQELERLEKEMAVVEEVLEEPAKTSFVNESAKRLFATWPKEELVQAQTKHSYESPEGILFVSMCDGWTESGLEELYQELLRNKHGEELYTLQTVYVYGYEDEYAAATHQNVKQSSTFRLHYPAIPRTFLITLSRSAGVISLYDGDNKDTAEKMASSLSHEYGHHYTFSYMLDESDREGMLKSEYARLRGFEDGYALVDNSDDEFYYDNHYRYLYEMAAEDYVMLMGSPNSRSIADYHDIQDLLYGEEDNVEYGRNAKVQENLMIPIASDVEGLAEYFYSFIDEPMPEFEEKKDIMINIDSYSVAYDLVSGYREFVTYTVDWNKAYGDDAVYTLVSFREEDPMHSFASIRTVWPGMDAEACIGEITWKEGNTVYYWEDGIAEGTRCFVVTVIKPDGTVYISDIMRYDFG